MGSVWCTITRCVVLSLSFGHRSCDILGRGIRGAEREICTALAPELHWGGGGGGIWTSLRHTARGSEWTVLGFRNSGVQVGQERNIRALLTFKGPDASLAVTDRVKEDPRNVHHRGFDLLSTDKWSKKTKQTLLPWHRWRPGRVPCWCSPLWLSAYSAASTGSCPVEHNSTTTVPNIPFQGQCSPVKTVAEIIEITSH